MTIASRTTYVYWWDGLPILKWTMSAIYKKSVILHLFRAFILFFPYQRHYNDQSPLQRWESISPMYGSIGVTFHLSRRIALPSQCLQLATGPHPHKAPTVGYFWGLIISIWFVSFRDRWEGRHRIFPLNKTWHRRRAVYYSTVILQRCFQICYWSSEP